MIRVVAAIIEYQSRLLICQRRHGTAFALKWEFPGGKMRAGETPWEALGRELREELAVKMQIGREVWRAYHRYEELQQPVAVSFFSAILLNADRVQTYNSSSARFVGPRRLLFERILWAQRSDLRRYDFLAADREVVNRLARGELLTHDRQPRMCSVQRR